jgi:hypothetical protein
MEFVLQGRCDVERGIRDDQRIRMTWRIHDEAVADLSVGPDAGIAGSTAPISSSVRRLPFISASTLPFFRSKVGRRNGRQFWPTGAIKAAASHDGRNNVLPHRD